MPDLVADILETLNTLAAPALAEVMETMAFLCANPLPRGVRVEAPASAACVRLWLPFTGLANGVVEIAAPETLGSVMTANMLCSDSARHDALLELLNMTCGVLFRNASTKLDASFDMGLPQAAAFDGSQWQDFCSRDGAMLLDVEGTIIAVGVFLDGGK